MVGGRYGVQLGSKVVFFSGTKSNFSATKINISGTKNNFSATKIPCKVPCKKHHQVGCDGV